jgi:hypothetical protein
MPKCSISNLLLFKIHTSMVVDHMRTERLRPKIETSFVGVICKEKLTELISFSI